MDKIRKNKLHRYIVIAVCAVLLAVIITVTVLKTTNGGKNSNNTDVSAAARLLSKEMNIDLDIEFSYNWYRFITSDVNTFDPELAKMSLLLCLSSHQGVDIVSDSFEGVSGGDAFLASLGLSDAESIKVTAESGTDKEDETSMNISHIQCENKGKICQFVNVSFMGTNSEKEWASNFDLGDDSGVYETVTGSHPEWTDKDNHKGFDVAANRAIKQIIEYVNRHGIISEKNESVLFDINGYSRGAAIANIVASKFNTGEFAFGEKAECVAYTFATPNTTVSKKAADFGYIFNIVNKDDIVGSIPPASLGFTRYGTSTVFDLTEEQNSSLLTKYTEISGKKYNNDMLCELAESLDALCDSRSDFYEIPYGSDTTAVVSAKSALEAENRRASTEKFIRSICGENYGGFCKISEIKEIEKNGVKTYSYAYRISPAVIGKIILNAIKSSKSGDLAALYGMQNFFSTKKYEELKTLFTGLVRKNKIGNIADMHFPTAYYVYIDSLTK